ncbi:hypothetical protein D3C76_1016160 [compost metagenome]
MISRICSPLLLVFLSAKALGFFFRALLSAVFDCALLAGRAAASSAGSLKLLSSTVDICAVPLSSNQPFSPVSRTIQRGLMAVLASGFFSSARRLMLRVPSRRNSLRSATAKPMRAAGLANGPKGGQLGSSLASSTSPRPSRERTASAASGSRVGAEEVPPASTCRPRSSATLARLTTMSLSSA